MSIPVFAAAMLLAGFFACDIGTFPANTPLHPPLGLTLISSNQGEIYVEFWAFNNEEAFAGFNIYMAQSESEVSNRLAANCLTNYLGGFPSMRNARFSDVDLVKYTLRDGPSAAPLASGSVWYITVSAYDGYSGTDSRLGEIKPVTVM
jgi:hypothetical protein